MERRGCKHYQRRCEIQAPCCKLWYPCRLCHNEEYKGVKAPGCKVETMDRHAVDTIRCLLCQKEQAPGPKCVGCNEEFAKYYCGICKFWNDNPMKGIYHCEKCGICRVGKADDYFHCDNCKGDFPKEAEEGHECTSFGMHSNCPICFEDMFSSRKNSQRMPICGHFIHSKCLKDYLRTSRVNRCPICSKDIFKEDEEQIRHIDEMLASTRANLPKEVIDMKVSILCNNCLQKTGDVPFHFLGLKCGNCGSYNTRQIDSTEIKSATTPTENKIETENTAGDTVAVENNAGNNNNGDAANEKEGEEEEEEWYDCE